MVLQHKLGAKNAGAFDVNCACAAFPTLVAIGSGLIATNAAIKTLLLVGADIIHKLADPNDAGSFLWGDGAGAVVMEGGNRSGVIGAAFQADGTYASNWGIHAGGTFEPASIDAVKAGRTQVRREGETIPRPSMKIIGRGLFKGLCDQCGFAANQVDHLLFTQISMSSLRSPPNGATYP